MTSRRIALGVGVLICMLSAPVAPQGSKDWVDIKNPKELRAIYTNKTFRGKDGRGEPFVAHYRADGKGILIMAGQRIPRTWEVKGNQVCITDPKVTNCFELQRHKKNRNDIVARHVTGMWIFQFTVEDGIPEF